MPKMMLLSVVLNAVIKHNEMGCENPRICENQNRHC